MVTVIMEEYRPMVSVIVLTYNHEKYIKQALDSILRQKVNFDYEILIGDDASTDNTVKVLKEYKSKYSKIIKLFLNEVNLGATRNAYNLLVNAKGKYLATCEGDDYWTDDNKLQIQVEFLEKNKELVGCSHYFTVVDEDNKPYKNQYLSWVKQKEIFTLNDFEGMFLPGQPATFLRRNLFLNKSIDFSYLYKIHRNVGDKTLMMIYLLYGNFALIKRNMSCYRKSYNNSLTGEIYKNKSRFLYEDYKILKDFEKILLLYDKNIKFFKGKKIIFAKTVYFYVKSLKKDYLDLTILILKENKNYIKFIIYVPLYYFTRLIKSL